jgi:hypothetical protein
MKNKPTPDTSTPPPSAITTLAELRAVIAQPLTCEFEIDGRPVRLSVLRLMPAVDELRRAVLRAVTPIFVKERGDYDLRNPQYVAQTERAEDEARSLVIYHCCPEIQATQPGLTEPAAIHAFIRNLLPPMVQDLIAVTVMRGGIQAQVERRANFISTPASAS